MYRPTIAIAVLLGVLAVSHAQADPDVTDTVFLGQPAISDSRIAFTYADDLWTAKPDGTDVRRLTSHGGVELNPFFSPDGKKIAFTAQYDGNVDVYIVPTEGGVPTRLTYHPGPDIVRGFTPEGDVLFASPRAVFSPRHTQFYTVGQKGGFPKQLRVPHGDKGAVSGDGKYLAYTPLSEAFRQWKNYRGGRESRVWILKLEDLSVDQIPQPKGGCNDIDPMWVDSTVYFISDRDGEFNLYSYDRASKEIKKHTDHTDFPIEAASAGAGKVIYEQAGRLHVYDPSTRQSTCLKVGVAADLVETRPRMASAEKFIRLAGISPSGKRAVISYRGEVVTVPAKKGDIRNITQTPGVHERSPIWSPDGRSIAYFSDASGEYALHVKSQDGKGDAKTYSLKGSGYYDRPSWSPDSKKISFIDNSRTLYVIDLDSGKPSKVASDAVYGPVNTMSHAWSPDSQWLAYTLTNSAYFQTLRVYSVSTDKSRTLTNGLAEVADPSFDAGGKYLYFLASTDAGPVKQWFDQSNADLYSTHSIYVAVLAKHTPSPLRKDSDEEEPDSASKKDGDSSKKDSDASKNDDAKDGDSSKDSKDTNSNDKPKKVVVTIDFDGIENRVLALPIPAGSLSEIEGGAEGFVYYLRSDPPSLGVEGPGRSSLHRFDLKKKEVETLADDVQGYRLSANHKKLLYRSGTTIGIVDAGKFKKGDGVLDTKSISVHIEPRAEWAEMFRDAWRINRDYFYARNMHGADWDGIRKKYEALLPHLATRGDLEHVIRLMLSELSVGHSYQGPGERLYEPKNVPVGLLGADYEIDDGRYRFKRIYGGLNWDPRLRAPLKAPGIDVKPGEYLLAVNGKPVTADEDLFSHFENTVGKLVELKVGPDASGEKSRTVVAEPIASEAALRNREWVEGNLRKVHEKTNGRVAYVYVPNTADLGYIYFKRYFFPQVDKQAIIVDERFNGGGSIADYYIDALKRTEVSRWAMRYGEEIRTPGAAIFGPKVMIVDETAGSGGDMLPWMFRQAKLGKIIGRRTWGGLVGILGFPVLMDGGSVTAPDLAIFTEDGYIVENVGVPPDIEVEQWPAAVAEGADPQLDKAIEVILEELEKNPPKTVRRPPDPVRVRRPNSGGQAQ
jgi:tricorn protease